MSSNKIIIKAFGPLEIQLLKGNLLWFSFGSIRDEVICVIFETEPEVCQNIIKKVCKYMKLQDIIVR